MCDVRLVCVCVALFPILAGRDAPESTGPGGQTGAGDVAANVEEPTGLVGERAGAPDA